MKNVSAHVIHVLEVLHVVQLGTQAFEFIKDVQQVELRLQMLSRESKKFESLH